MKKLHVYRTRLAATIAVTGLLSINLANATVVEIQTVVGNIEVNLYDNETPETVGNFLDYVMNGDYTSSIIHRAATPAGFVIQGGGFTFGLAWPATGISERPSVVNEPELSNVRGTIAMAKLNNQPNSATSQWFINIGNNAAILDGQNGGFTVFGEVTMGLDVADNIDGLQRFNFGGAFSELPLLANNGGNPDATNLIIVNDIVITDPDPNTANGLNPTPNTIINQPPPTTPPVTGGGGGGGVIAWWSIALLSAACAGGAIRRSRRSV